MDKYNLKLNYKRFGIDVSISASETDVDIGANTSYVSVSITVTTNGTSYNNSGSAYVEGSVTCNNQSHGIGRTGFTISKTSTKTVYSGKLGPFYHNSDGTCPSANINVYCYLTSSTSKSASASCGMSTIPRKPNITFFSVDKVDETSVKFNWSADSNCDYAWYSTNNGASWADLPMDNIIHGLSDDTSYDFRLKLRRTDSQLTNESNTVRQSTYAYPRPGNTSDFTIGDCPGVVLDNPLRRDCVLELISKNDGSTIGRYSGTYSGIVQGEFNTSEAISAQYTSIPNSIEGTYYAKVTYSDKPAKTSNESKYRVNQSSCLPIFTNFTFNDVNSKTVALTGSTEASPKLINGYSKLRATISTANKASAKNSATMSQYKLANGSMIAYSRYLSSATVTIGDIVAVSSNVLVSAIDSRGISKSVSKSATLIDYYKPSIVEITAARSDSGVGDEVRINGNGIWWNGNFGATNNSISKIEYYFKKSTDSDYIKGTSNITFSVSGNNFYISNVKINSNVTTGVWDLSTVYDLKLVVTDKLDTSLEYAIKIQGGTPGLAIYQNKVAIGNKYDTSLGGPFQVNGQCGAYYPVGSIYLSINDTNPSTFFGGTWEQIAKGRTLVGVDTNDTDFNTSEKTGGSKSVTLNTNQIPSHTHNVGPKNYGSNLVYPEGCGASVTGTGLWALTVASNEHGLEARSTGGGQAHTNLQPYFTCYIWCRIA